MFNIEILSKSNLEKYMDEIILLDLNTFKIRGNQYSSKPWTKNNFLKDLNGKWNFSLVVLQSNDKKVLGFSIFSQKSDFLHLHRIAINENYMRHGIGKKMLSQTVNKLEKSNLKRITLFVPESNSLAYSFYLKNNFVRAEGAIFEKIIKNFDKSSGILDNQMIDESGISHYLMYLDSKEMF